ncbi:GDP-L-fucose synthase family protein [Yunchengibacter salinarum]|uniref:GDP-L-fucose synthase family protein n=1 Tax=Yunchengibacter salinarum TaxID=3133399 RepID=UPI0035B58074
MSETLYPLENKKVLVTGSAGMVGSAVVRRLEQESCQVRPVARKDGDLTRQRDAEALLQAEAPDVVVIAAAKVGGILANDTYPADFLYDNLMIAANVIHAAHESGVTRLLFMGSSCIYPKFAQQPMEESSLLTGPLEPTNEAYAVAKIAGIKLCDAYRRQYGRHYISAMPTNLYGPGDNYDLKNSHVLPALVRKMVEAREAGSQSVEIWGDGSPLREFMHVDDLADACVFLLKSYDREGPINVGTGEEVSIRQLAEMIAAEVGFDGDLVFDTEKPNGTPRKLMDSSLLREAGWSFGISLERGIEKVVADYLNMSR